MYVEDESDKIIRLAQIKAYGRCESHQGHFGWSEYWLGIATVIFIGMIGAATIFGSDRSTHPTAIGMQYTCYTSDPKNNLNTGYSGYITVPGSQTFESNSICSFNQ